VIGPIAALEQRAATLSQCVIQAAAVARDVAADAADIDTAHANIVAQHRKMFLVVLLASILMAQPSLIHPFYRKS
jgi:hypothetical protein